MAVQTKYTIEEFEKMVALPENAERLLEFIKGEIVEKVPSELDGFIAGWIGTFINMFLINNNFPGITTAEASHKTGGDDPVVLMPDVSFIGGERTPVPEGHVPRMPDLAVEIKSKSNTYIGLREKALIYLANGTLLVWLVFPKKRLVEVYRPGQDVEIMDINDTLDGGDVLPGFSLPVSKIFERIQ